MEDPSKFQQMQDEMSRFEAEISGPGGASLGMPRSMMPGFGDGPPMDHVPPPPPPPVMLRPPFDPSMMMPRMMFPSIPPPPPPPSLLIPSQVRMRSAAGPDSYSSGASLRSMPGPAAMPPQKPQPVVLSAAPKLYKQTKPKDLAKEKEKEKEREREREREEKRKVVEPPPPPPKPQPPPAPEVIPPPAAIPMQTDGAQSKTKKEKKNRKTIRAAGGTTWEDQTLLDWPEDDFRLFAGDLGNDVTDELLVRTFSKYSSFTRAKVIRDKRTNKSKGFGFISFREPQDFIKAMKEMNGRYVGSRPIKLRKSTWRNRSLDVVRKKEKEKAALLALLLSGKQS